MARFSRLVFVAIALVFLLVSALSKKGERIRGAALLLAWLIPGAGHVLLGKWKKGLFFFGILTATYLFGMWIVGFRPVSWDDNPFYFVGQYGSGATLAVAMLRGSEKAILRPEVHPSWFDPGLLYVCVVGLLNLVILLNIFDLKIEAPASAEAAAGRPEPDPVPPPPPAVPVSVAPAPAAPPAPAPEKTA